MYEWDLLSNDNKKIYSDNELLNKHYFELYTSLNEYEIWMNCFLKTRAQQLRQLIWAGQLGLLFWWRLIVLELVLLRIGSHIVGQWTYGYEYLIGDAFGPDGWVSISQMVLDEDSIVRGLGIKSYLFSNWVSYWLAFIFLRTKETSHQKDLMPSGIGSFHRSSYMWHSLNWYRYFTFRQDILGFSFVPLYIRLDEQVHNAGIWFGHLYNTSNLASGLYHAVSYFINWC